MTMPLSWISKCRVWAAKIIELHNVHKRYGDLILFKGFDYKFRKGDRVGIVGNNGSGKTTPSKYDGGQ